jgi:hypothetical protein
MYYCDPEWHSNKMTDAAFLIQPLEKTDQATVPGFAACENHAGRALRIMLQQSKAVRVREVNNK